MTGAVRRGAAALLVVATVAGAGLSPARAVPSQSSTSSAPADLGLLRLVEQTPVVDPEGTFTAQVSTTGAPPGSMMRVVLHAKITTRSQYQLTVSGGSLGRTLATPIRDTPLDTLPHAGDDTVVVSIPIRATGTDTSRLRLASAGVYAVEVDLYDSEGARLDQLITHLVRLPSPDDDLPPLAVALVVPVHGGPALQPDGTTTLSDADRAGLLKVSAELLRQPAVPLSLVATPETLDALAEATEPGDDNIIASLASAASGREIVPGPYVRLQLGSWTQPSLLPVFDEQVSRGSDVLAERLGTMSPSTWVADDTVDDTAVTALHGRGVRRVVVPESALAPLDPEDFSRTLARRFTVGSAAPLDAAVADAALAAYAGATDDPVLDAANLVGDLATIFFDEPPAQRGAVVRIPDTWAPDASFLRAVLAGLTPSTLFRPVTIDQFFTVVPESSTGGGLADGDPVLHRDLEPQRTQPLGSFPVMLLDGRAALETYRSAIGDDSPRADPLERLLLVSCSADLPVSGRMPYVDSANGTIDTELNKVDAPPEQTITLTSRSGRIPITIRNAADYPLTVTLHLESDRLEMPELTNGSTTLTLENETTRIEVAVRARTSGDSPLDVLLTTPDGRMELDRTTYRVRSTAVSGVGLVLSIGAGLFLLVWWARTIRRDRRRRAGLVRVGRHARA
jgi:hypothetical protein